MLLNWKKYKFFKKQIKGKIVFQLQKTLQNSIIQILKDYKLQKKF